MIASYGATANELQAVFIKMHDFERLTQLRRTASNLKALGFKGTIWYSHLSLLLGNDMETQAGKCLGLTFGDKARGTIKPLYECCV